MKHVFLTALTATSIGALGTAAHAQTFTAGTTEQYTFGDDLGLGGAALLDLTLDTVVNGLFTFSYDLTNNTDGTLNPQGRVTSFGFNDGTAVALDGDIVNGDFGSIDISGATYPNGHGTIAVCLFEANGSCTGNGDGIALGDTFSGTFTLLYDASLTSLDLSGFVVRYQSMGATGQLSSTGSVGEVPEPATWAMMLLGMGGIGYSMRRRRKLGLQQLA